MSGSVSGRVYYSTCLPFSCYVQCAVIKRSYNFVYCHIRPRIQFGVVV
jgi:hypothetical protein